MANPFAHILGLGYAGLAIFDGVPVPLLSSTPDVQENLLKSQGTISTAIPNAVGEVPIRDRSALNISLSMQLCRATAALAGQASVAWWLAGLNGRSHTLNVYGATGLGFTSPEAYVSSVGISVPDNSLGTVTFNITAYRWVRTPGGVLPRHQVGFTPYMNPAYQPIPHWDTTCQHTGMPGITQAFNVNFNNNYAFNQLCEAYGQVPTPRMIYPSYLTVDLSLTTIATPGALYPAETGSCFIVLGGGKPGNTTSPPTSLTLPLLYRDPTHSIQGVGDQNGLIKWSAGWKGLGPSPS